MLVKLFSCDIPYARSRTNQICNFFWYKQDKIVKILICPGTDIYHYVLYLALSIELSRGLTFNKQFVLFFYWLLCIIKFHIYVRTYVFYMVVGYVSFILYKICSFLVYIPSYLFPLLFTSFLFGFFFLLFFLFDLAFYKIVYYQPVAGGPTERYTLLDNVATD